MAAVVPRASVPPDALVEGAAALVRARTGLHFAHGSRERLAAALAAELRRDPETDPDTLLARLEGDPTAVEALGAATTVAESYFFREGEHLEWLRRDVLPAFRSRGAGVPLRVWSAGCSSGEEPYSIAILLREMGYTGPARIVGSDLSPRILTRARRAVYSQWSLRATAPAIVTRWFRRTLGQFALDRSVRDSVSFVTHNLARDPFPPPESGFAEADLILCRNVLIYLDRATVARVAERLLRALGPDGWLLLGASDPPIAELTACEVVVTGSGLAYRRAGTLRDPDARAIDLRAALAPASDATAEADWRWEPPAPAPEPPASPAAEPAEPPPRENLLGVLAARYAARDYRGAVAVAERALREHADAEPVWVTMVRSLANLGDREQAGRAGALALERFPLSAELTYLAAAMQAEAGRHADAAASARRAVYLDHRLAVAHAALGAALARIGNRDEALRALGNAERLLQELPGDAVVKAGDGETAGAVLARVRAQRRLAEGGPGAR
jgi:chemotaxis protein methyltransferase CheR